MKLSRDGEKSSMLLNISDAIIERQNSRKPESVCELVENVESRRIPWNIVQFISLLSTKTSQKAVESKESNQSDLLIMCEY